MIMEVRVVSEALQQLYSPLTSPRVRRRADSLLQRFQRSPEAAHTALSVLQSPIPSIEGNLLIHVKAERAFAASTLYYTVTSYIRKYKLDDVLNWTLEDRMEHEAVTKSFRLLCQQTWDILTGPNATQEEFNVQTHLALTVAVIVLRFHELHHESTFVSVIESLISNQQRPPSTSCAITNFALLLTLKVIPEEVENKRIKFTKHRRIECELIVEKAASIVIRNVLPSIAITIDTYQLQGRLRGLLLQSFASWVEYGKVSCILLLECGLLNRAFQETLDSSFSNDAFHVLHEVIQACENETHVPLMIFIMNEFITLGTLIQEKLSTDPQDVLFCLKNCAIVLTECGQSFIKYFIDYTLDSTTQILIFKFLETILSFTAIKEIEISNITMEFWIDFRIYISGKHEQRMMEYEIFISRLLDLLIERTQFPHDYQCYNETNRDLFSMYRNQVRSVFRALATVNTHCEDRFIVDAIHAIFRQYEILDTGNIPTEMWWRQTEVYVHALSALSKSLRQDDVSLVPRLFELLAREETHIHRALARTTTILLGVTAHWFAQNPEWIDHVAFRILSRNFSVTEQHELFPFRSRGQEDHAGAVALQKLARRCSHHLFKPLWLESVLQLYTTSINVFPREKATLIGKSLNLVVESLALIISSRSYRDMFPVVQELCTIMFSTLSNQLQHPEEEDSIEFVHEILDHLYILSTQIGPQMDQEVVHPMMIIFEKQWTILDSILHFYGTNDEIMNKFCSVFVGLFETLRLEALPLASAIMSPLLTQFAKTHSGNLLKVIQSVLICAGDDEETIASLTRVLVMVFEVSFSKIAASTSIDDEPVLIVALFELVRVCGTHRPLLLVHSNHFEALLSLLLHALNAQNPEVGAASLQLLLEIGRWYGEVQRLPMELLKNSENEGKLRLHQLIQKLFIENDLQYHLVVALFQAAGGAMPPSMIEEIAEVVRSCWLYFGKQRSDELMMRLLADDGVFASQVTPQARVQFVATISKSDCIDNSRKFRRVLSSFCDHVKKCVTSNGKTSRGNSKTVKRCPIGEGISLSTSGVGKSASLAIA